MGSIRKGVLGGFMGKVGSVVGSKWKGTYLLRSLPEVIKRKNISLKCLQQRARFTQTNRFISDARHLVRLGFRPVSKNRTTFNAAYDANDTFFQFENDHVVADFPNLQLSKGGLSKLENVHLTLDETGVLQIRWGTVDIIQVDGEECMVHLFVYRDDMQYSKSYIDLAKASDMSAEVMLTDSMKGHKLHLYAFYCTASALTKDYVSKTSYAEISAS
ncbi:DUF6266 family protein [Halosquirtibacter xylanolyticus]|uniref:DUF6266 family protein n=1 Tax=Halosquirtibacter xylanolyticus TaxID=3374599 RepID=UPI003748B948|nr:DUF6266 family protein [Prolixibacteraceae bacterium]